MATRLLRLEKKADGKCLYIEYQREAQNAIKRLWNSYGHDGRPTQKQERENFQTSTDLETYVMNAKTGHEKNGFETVLAEDFMAKTIKKTSKKKEAETSVAATELS